MTIVYASDYKVTRGYNAILIHKQTLTKMSPQKSLQ